MVQEKRKLMGGRKSREGECSLGGVEGGRSKRVLFPETFGGQQGYPGGLGVAVVNQD
jgi:hypothetical protein